MVKLISIREVADEKNIVICAKPFRQTETDRQTIKAMGSCFMYIMNVEVLTGKITKADETLSSTGSAGLLKIAFQVVVPFTNDFSRYSGLCRKIGPNGLSKLPEGEQSRGLTPTWAEVHGGVETLYCATLQITRACSISGEEHHFVPEVGPEQLGKVTQVVVVTGEVAAIFILHLTGVKEIRRGCNYFILFFF